MSIKIVEAYEVQGKLFTDWSEACKYERSLNKKEFLYRLRELEGKQRLDKKKAAQCVFRYEPFISKQAQMQRLVKRQSNELREMYKALDEINVKNSLEKRLDNVRPLV
jgi:hypothetical protein